MKINICTDDGELLKSIRISDLVRPLRDLTSTLIIESVSGGLRIIHARIDKEILRAQAEEEERLAGRMVKK